MRYDETAKLITARLLVHAGLVIASPVLLIAGAPIRARYLRHVFRDDAPPIIDKPNRTVTVHHYLATNRLQYWLCRPSQSVVDLRHRRSRSTGGR
ncbi:hypothetical protein ACFVFS_19185 [Kitasatospora sp. NPDC057692]|uniref:hypothetical protein n=1 Tax=Kitasatospora sp. NPDC057692 TaxID=3346215 RepID=UPI0036C3556B